VAASLVAIVERELRLGAGAAAREQEAIAGLLDEAGEGRGGDLADERARLADALRHGLADDDVVAARVWAALMDVVRDDLAIAKPGHDEWDGD
jgi:hypothetical protein